MDQFFESRDVSSRLPGYFVDEREDAIPSLFPDDSQYFLVVNEGRKTSLSLDFHVESTPAKPSSVPARER